MPEATYDVRIAWGAKPPNAFTIGLSTLGGGDILVGQFATTFSGAHDDLSAIVKRWRSDRGRDDFIDMMRSGIATIAVHDPTGKFNPKNPTSVIAGQVIPMRPVRIRATFLSVTYTLFYGFLTDVEHDAEAKETTFQCADLFTWMSRVRPVIAAGATTTGAALARILDAVGWTDPTLRDLDTGDTIPSFTADGSRDALGLVQDLLEAERGVAYVRGDGVFTFDNRYTRGIRATDATLTGVMADMRPSTSLDRIRNRWTVTRDGGVAQVAADGDSIAAYGEQSGEVTTRYLLTDAQAAYLAQYLVAIYRDPRPPLQGLTLKNTSDTLLTQALARELGHRVSVSAVKGGTAGDFIIERISHEATDGGKYHTTTWTLSERPADAPFQIGASTLGGGHVLVY